MYEYGNIILKEITEDDAETLFKLIKNGTLFFYRPGIHNICTSVDKVKERIYFHRNLEPRLEIECFIYKKAYTNPIGIVSLQGIDNYNKIAELNFMMFLKPAGIYALKAVVMALYLAFSELNLEKIYFYVSEFNKNFLTFLKKRGFKEEAILKKEIIYNNKRYDLYRFSIFPEDRESLFWQKILKLIKFRESDICLIKS